MTIEPSPTCEHCSQPLVEDPETGALHCLAPHMFTVDGFAPDLAHLAGELAAAQMEAEQAAVGHPPGQQRETPIGLDRLAQLRASPELAMLRAADPDDEWAAMELRYFLAQLRLGDVLTELAAVVLEREHA